MPDPPAPELPSSKENAIKWVAGWPANPDADFPEMAELRRMHMMEAVRMYVETDAATSLTVSEEIIPGYFLQVDISFRDQEGRPVAGKGDQHGTK